MRKSIYFLIVSIIILSSTPAFAQTINFEQAVIIAQNSLFERYSTQEYLQSKSLQILDGFTETINETDVYHVLRLKSGGFIIIAAHMSVYPVLAFSFEGDFRKEDMHPAIRWWLESYAKQIESNVLEGAIINEKFIEEWNRLLTPNSAFIAKTNIKTTTPLIKTKWNQGLYYNSHCPPDPAGTDGRTVVGCVAVALGQIMNYFRHPETGIGSYSYYHDVYGLQSVNFEEQYYNYDHMPIRPTDYNDDLAKLLYHIGVSVDMNYGPNGSGMYNHKGAYTLYTYFKYNSDTQYLFRDSLPEDFDWHGTLIDHLDNKIPLYYAGWSDTLFIMGHAFVLDAYSDSTHYHINWGWGGSYDGFFYIENLKPGGSDFTLLHEVIVNAVPDTFSGNCQGLKELTTFEGIIDDGSGPINNYSSNLECEWLVTPQDSANGIEFKFLNFEISDDDFIILFDGDNEQSPVLRTFYGTDNPSVFESSGDKVLIKFFSGENEGNSGWLLSYTGKKPKYCNLSTTLTEHQGIISDGSNNYMYQNNTFCTWRIQPVDAEDIRITFLEFDIEPIHDYIQILDANNQSVATLSGYELPESILLSGNRATVTFRSNANIRAGGFKLLYETNVGSQQNGIEEKVKIYPNPAETSIFIYLNDNLFIDDVLIYNSIGQYVFSHSKFTESSVIEIDISNLYNGIYFITIVTDKGIIRSKFLKK